MHHGVDIAIANHLGDERITNISADELGPTHPAQHVFARRNRVDREGVKVLTIKPGPVKTGMTAGMKGSEKFADVNAVAKTIAAAVEAGSDTLYVPAIWQPIMFVIRNVPERIFKKLNL